MVIPYWTKFNSHQYYTSGYMVLALLSHVSVLLVGKSGLVGERFASSLSSVGIISHYVHACEWVHGDLGKIQK